MHDKLSLANLSKSQYKRLVVYKVKDKQNITCTVYIETIKKDCDSAH